MKAGKTLVELATEIQARAAAKVDLVAPTRKMGVEIVADRPRLIIGDRDFDINTIAHGQIAEFTDVPKKYYDRMMVEEPKLLADNLNTWLRRADDKRLVRTLGGTNRAFLSDRYRPLENEELAEAVLPALMELGLDVMSSEITDRRLYIKAVDPKVTRELDAIGGKFGDGKHNIVRCLSPAITISNSEVGCGALSVLGGVYDGFCSNLATFGARSLRKYHIGGKHEMAGEEFYALLSDETRRKTDAATWAQVGDVVRGAFNRASFDALVDTIDKTRDQKIEGDVVEVVKLTTRKLGLTEADGKSVLTHLIEGADLSRFGLYNAITRAAQDVEDYDKATEMERGGAQIIELPVNEWKVLSRGELAKAA